MNRLHQWLCGSDRWRSTVALRLPWEIGDTDLGPDVLEIGPGPGLTTDLLRTSVPRLTALEIVPPFARVVVRNVSLHCIPTDGLIVGC